MSPIDENSTVYFIMFNFFVKIFENAIKQYVNRSIIRAAIDFWARVREVDYDFRLINKMTITHFY